MKAEIRCGMSKINEDIQKPKRKQKRKHKIFFFKYKIKIKTKGKRKRLKENEIKMMKDKNIFFRKILKIRKNTKYDEKPQRKF